MANPTTTDYNIETGVTTIHTMTDAEYAAWLAIQPTKP